MSIVGLRILPLVFRANRSIFYKRANRYRPGTLLFAITKKMKVGLKPISLRHSVNVTAKMKNRNFGANISAKSNPYSKMLKYVN